MATHCIVCGGTELLPLVDIADAPVHCNLLCESREEALAVPRARMELTVCDDCGHIFNKSFDPNRMLYGGAYENSLHGSPRFRLYVDALAERLVGDHGLRGKDIIEIGCGDGRFLEMICRKGGNCGVGFDPSAQPRRGGLGGEDVEIIPACYGEAYTGYKGDAVICRHVLEHVANPGAFIDLLRSAMKDSSSILYIEVPNGLYTLQSGLVWDLIYEHCSYFCESSLSRVLQDCGLSVCRLASSFDGQMLSAEAIPSQAAATAAMSPKEPQSVAYVDGFQSRFCNMVDDWRRYVTGLARSEGTLVAWGAGSKGVSFLNQIDPGNDAVRYIIDVNPKKSGKFVAGAGQQIIAPEALKSINPNRILLMNPAYLEEVRTQVAALGLSPTIIEVVTDMVTRLAPLI